MCDITQLPPFNNTGKESKSKIVEGRLTNCLSLQLFAHHSYVLVKGGNSVISQTIF